MSEQTQELQEQQLSRRRFLAYFSSIGLGATLLPGILWAKLQEEKALRVNKEMLGQAEKLAGLEYTDEERDLMLEGLDGFLDQYDALRKLKIENSVVPALNFNPVPVGMTLPKESKEMVVSKVGKVSAPAGLDQVAFWPVTHLAELIKKRQVTSTDLTKMYLGRLKQYDPKLQCVITLTEELALKQAKKADAEIAAGNYKGPLHGIPWGAKDLLAAKGYKTTWGAKPYEDQVIDMNATVVERLEAAGAVLVAKLSLGALAWGDVWYGGKTKNPWNTEQGSSGSSAGPASATAAGLVGFSIGTETLGSIVSPATRCGVTGLRPTYGRVSRHGAMALSWSMDKIGPICRSVEDCAIVFDAICGPDGKDSTLMDVPFNWNANLDATKLRVGYVKSAFDRERNEESRDWQALDNTTLDKLRSLGFNLKAIALPDYPIRAMRFILSAEAAAAFSQLTLTNRDDLMVRQISRAWPNANRQARMIPAVEYIQANRLRSMVIDAMAETMEEIDVYLAPSFGGVNLTLTNLTGHPTVVLPNGFRENGTPTSITFMGKLFGEAETLAVAKAYQDATDFHKKHPVLET